MDPQIKRRATELLWEVAGMDAAPSRYERRARALLVRIAEDLRRGDARTARVGALPSGVDACGPRGPARAEAADPLVYHEKKVPASIPARERALRPAVGHAQIQLNAFLAHFDQARLSPATSPLRAFCRGNATLAAELRAGLPAQIAVDCRFGDQTERATRVFQVCQGLKNDGRIGPETWRLLHAVPRPPSLLAVVGQDEKKLSPGENARAKGFEGVKTLATLATAKAHSAEVETTVTVGHAVTSKGKPKTRVTSQDAVDDALFVDTKRPISATFFADSGSQRPILLVMSGIHPEETVPNTPGGKLAANLERALRDGKSAWLQHFNVVFMPNVNPGGAGRTNPRGVNLNRNFFGEFEARGGLAVVRPSGDCEPNSKLAVRTPPAARQPETQAVMDVISVVKPHKIVALHGTRRIRGEGVFVDIPPDPKRADAVMKETARIADAVIAKDKKRFLGNQRNRFEPRAVMPKLDPHFPLYKSASRNVAWPFQDEVGPFSLGTWASCRGIPVFTVEPHFGTAAAAPDSLVTTLADALQQFIRPNA